MNEEELKSLWQTDSYAPTVDFTRLQKLSDDWHDKLRRKARVDAWAQGITAVLCILPSFYYPKLSFASLLALAIGIWYVRELKGLYKNGKFEIGSATVRQSIEAKIKTLTRYFWRTRIALYIFTPLILLATYYGLGIFEKYPFANIVNWLVKVMLLAEIIVAISTEVYFKILYTPALKELKSLLQQIESAE